MKKYKVPFTGFAYVEAESEAEALDYALYGNTIYEEQNWEDAKEVSEFLVDGRCLRNGMDD